MKKTDIKKTKNKDAININKSTKKSTNKNKNDGSR